MRLDLGLGDVMVVGKSQQRDEVLRKWARGALACKGDTSLAWRVLSGQQVAELAFKLLEALFQLGNSALQGFCNVSRHVSWSEHFQVTERDFTTVRLRILSRKFSRTDRSLDGFVAHAAKLCSSLNADIFALSHHLHSLSEYGKSVPCVQTACPEA